MNMFGYAAYIGYGWNDLIINGAGASTQAIYNRYVFGQWARNAGCLVSPSTLWPAASSTDNWSTITNETVEGYETGRIAINADARSPGTPGVYNAPVMDLESYLYATNGSGIVPNVVSPIGIPFGNGWVSSTVSSTQFTPKDGLSGTADKVLVNSVSTALNGTDPQSPYYGNFGGGINIAMTSGTNNGAVYPISGNNGTVLAMNGYNNTGIAVNDTFNLNYQLSQGVHLPTRQQISLGAQTPMLKAVGF
jgi:hypothetical protein